MRFSDRIVAPNGYVYENEGMEYIVVKRGLIREIHVFLDVEKVAALDAQLGTPSLRQPAYTASASGELAS